MLHTSTKALNLLSSFEVMWRASEWKGELSPTKISVRHFNLFNPSVISGLLQVGKKQVVTHGLAYSQTNGGQYTCAHTKLKMVKEIRSRSYWLIAWRNRKTFALFLSSSSWKRYMIKNQCKSNVNTPNNVRVKKEQRSHSSYREVQGKKKAKLA